MKSVKVIMQNPLDKKDKIDYTIIPNDTQLAKDWIAALEQDVLQKSLHLEKNYCFLGFPDNPRDVEYICNQINQHCKVINRSKIGYRIEEYFVPDAVMFDESFDDIYNDEEIFKHGIMNQLHNHFEVLQGTVENLSEYYIKADVLTKYSIRQLNNLCHEMECLCLSIKNKRHSPEWIRPAQITTFLNTPRHLLTDEHRKGFAENYFDRELGGVYMHWCQIGKTLWEVYKDEGAPKLTDTVCEAITHLQYYSGEFDIDWADTITPEKYSWRKEELAGYEKWLIENNYDPLDPQLSNGYLKLGQVDLINSFGTSTKEEIWKILSEHLDICRIEVDGISCDYNYTWTDIDYEVRQLKQLGYI
jgi:hypothetical protein